MPTLSSYFKMQYDKAGKHLFTSTLIPNRGAWIEYETDSNDVLYVRIDKNRKIPNCSTPARIIYQCRNLSKKSVKCIRQSLCQF